MDCSCACRCTKDLCRMDPFPFSFCVGRTGFGLIGGCGAGIGFLSPLQLRGVPAVGQIVGSLAVNLRSFDSTLGHPGHKASLEIMGMKHESSGIMKSVLLYPTQSGTQCHGAMSRFLHAQSKRLIPVMYAQVRGGVRSLGVKGLDCSAGCGVFLGYGFGVGLFLKPRAAEAMQLSMQKLKGALSTYSACTDIRIQSWHVILLTGDHHFSPPSSGNHAVEVVLEHCLMLPAHNLQGSWVQHWRKHSLTRGRSTQRIQRHQERLP